MFSRQPAFHSRILAEEITLTTQQLLYYHSKIPETAYMQFIIHKCLHESLQKCDVTLAPKLLGATLLFRPFKILFANLIEVDK